MNELIKAIAGVNSSWSFAAFGIAGAVLLWRGILASKGAPTNSVVWGGVVVICFLGGVPFVVRAYIATHPAFYVFHIRTLVVDPQGNPISGAALRTTASNETATTHQGIGEISVFRGAMPADGKITIYADLAEDYLHGRVDITLDKDPNPSVTIQLKADGSATVVGLVEDQARHAIADASVSVLGGESAKTGPDGMFNLKTNAGVGQEVRLHVEKAGCSAIDQDHPAGRGQATITLTCARRNRLSR